ncbi:MAG: replication-associated recombination protein A [Candidatus Moranbacteria bacterium]|jgi:putative ATPase|nr:replication-associated recombination protein A [Candidatus Moranbacteria bacterium]
MKDTHDVIVPLPERMRPQSVETYLGQEKIFGEGSFLREAVRSGMLPSLIFWGPPGSGKTTLARILARELDSVFVNLSAVSSGKKDLTAVLEQAERDRLDGKRTILFLDEIHRWNKAQQDALLPFVEAGVITLVGATTENPSFSVNSALLSRTRVLVLQSLSSETIAVLLKRALREDEILLAKKVQIEDGVAEFLAEASGGDARQALSALEACAFRTKKVTMELAEAVMQRSHLLYDKKGEWHYDVISALHKSLRGSDADGALYWLGRMLEAGEDPLYVARRLIRFASEDVGLANSFALPQAVAALEACRHLGMPECELSLAQAVVYLAKSKKSNALYEAYGRVKDDIRKFPNEPVPLHLRNAPTKLMKNLGYGQGYKYTPKFKDPEASEQEYLPEKLKGKKYIVAKWSE